MTALLVLILSLCTTIAWFGVIIIFPWCQVSRYRYRLWHLRDDIVDDCHAGRFKNREQARLLLRDVEVLIRIAPHFTIFNLVTAARVSKRVQLPETERLNLDCLEHSDAELVSGYATRLVGAVTRHLLFGSPSGWVVTVVLVPYAFAKAVYGARRRGGKGISEATRQEVREELPEFEPALAVARAQGPYREPLSACV